jgi:hypothetical protein
MDGWRGGFFDAIARPRPLSIALWLYVPCGDGKGLPSIPNTLLAPAIG